MQRTTRFEIQMETRSFLNKIEIILSAKYCSYRQSILKMKQFENENILDALFQFVIAFQVN